jgi:hypothetical protein
MCVDMWTSEFSQHIRYVVPTVAKNRIPTELQAFKSDDCVVGRYMQLWTDIIQNPVYK